jgi:hypothetical protein
LYYRDFNIVCKFKLTKSKPSMVFCWGYGWYPEIWESAKRILKFSGFLAQNWCHKHIDKYEAMIINYIKHICWLNNGS